MGNELDLNQPYVAFAFTIANVGAGATPVDGILMGANGMGGPKVPAGYRFYPVHIDAEINDARTAGTSTIKVTADGAELTSGPEALIDDTNTLRDVGLKRGNDYVDAGEEIGVSATGSGTFAPTTADADVVVIGYFGPDI